MSVEVTNTGRVAGDEVVQLYLRDDVASVTRPVKELRAFEKITLKPGESRKLTLRLAAKDLGFHDDEGKLRIEPGPFKVFAGGSSETALSADFVLTGE